MGMAALFPRGARLLLANGYLATIPLGFQMVVVPLYLSRAGLDPAFFLWMQVVSGGLLATLAPVWSSGSASTGSGALRRWSRSHPRPASVRAMAHRSPIERVLVPVRTG